jgi:hypothetical protein
MSLEAIGRLLPWQVRDIFFHETDEQGRVALPQDGTAKNQGAMMEEEFRRRLRKQGCTEEEIDRKHDEFINRMLG